MKLAAWPIAPDDFAGGGCVIFPVVVVAAAWFFWHMRYRPDSDDDFDFHTQHAEFHYQYHTDAETGQVIRSIHPNE